MLLDRIQRLKHAEGGNVTIESSSKSFVASGKQTSNRKHVFLTGPSLARPSDAQKLIQTNGKPIKDNKHHLLPLLKRVPYARIETGLGFRPEAKFSRFFQLSAGAILGNSIELRNGELTASRLRLMLNLNAIFGSPERNSTSFHYHGGLELQDGMRLRTFTFGDSISKFKIKKSEFKHIQKEPFISTGIYINSGVIINGEVGLNVEALNQVGKILKERLDTKFA